MATLKGRLDGLRKAKNTTITRREREVVEVGFKRYTYCCDLFSQCSLALTFSCTCNFFMINFPSRNSCSILNKIEQEVLPCFVSPRRQVIGRIYLAMSFSHYQAKRNKWLSHFKLSLCKVCRKAHFVWLGFYDTCYLFIWSILEKQNCGIGDI